MQIEIENIPDLFSEPMQDFRLLKFYIKNNCKDSYCKILEKGVEYRFYNSSRQQDKLNLYGDYINICAIVGPNGSGKSSLLDLLYRLINNFGYLLYEDMYMPEAGEPKYLRDLWVTLTFEYGELPYTLSCEDDHMKLMKGHYGQREKIWEKVYNPPAGMLIRRKRPKGEYDTYINQRVDEKLSRIASNFFYTIVTNYSIQSLNYDDYADEGGWISSLFHKVDGYIHPIVLNPFRNEHGIDIENETELTKYRLSAILLHANMPNHQYQFIEGYKLHHIQYHLDASKYYEKIAEGYNQLVLKVRDDNEPLNLSRLSKEKAHDKINQFFIKAFETRDSYTNFILRTFFPNLKLDKNSDNVLISACVYFVYKILSATKYPNYATYYDSFKNPGKMLLCKKADTLLFTYVKQLKGEPSHIATKLYSCENFINNYERIKNRLHEAEANFDDFNFDQYNGNEPLYDIIGDIFKRLPPSIFKFEIYLSEVDRDFKVTSETPIPFGLLSSGERQFAYMMSTYIYHLFNLESIALTKIRALSGGGRGQQSDTNRIAYRMINLIFDEMELCFHPEYQRTFVKRLTNLLIDSKLNTIFSINIILTTHSPFVLSDIPLSNILFLKKGKVANNAVTINPFGANVNDILKQSFFLENGFMGELVRGWIISLCSYLYQNVNFSKFQRPDHCRSYQWTPETTRVFIEQIGDTLIKSQLMEAYFSKHDSKDARRQYLLDELKKLDDNEEDTH